MGEFEKLSRCLICNGNMPQKAGDDGEFLCSASCQAVFKRRYPVAHKIFPESQYEKDLERDGKKASLVGRVILITIVVLVFLGFILSSIK